MKKTTAGLTFAAITGFGLLSAGPAFAAQPATVPSFANCTEARDAGRTNIPSTDPEFSPRLDRNRNGIGCESDSTGTVVDPGEISDNDTGTGPGNGGPGPQVDQMPAGGANTGIAQAPEESNAAFLALSGGLVLAAAAGGTYVVRRRRTP